MILARFVVFVLLIFSVILNFAQYGESRILSTEKTACRVDIGLIKYDRSITNQKLALCMRETLGMLRLYQLSQLALEACEEKLGKDGKEVDDGPFGMDLRRTTHVQ